MPSPGAFPVTVNARRNVASRRRGRLRPDGDLTLTSAVTSTDTVKVRYTRPSTKPAAERPSGRAVNTFDQDVTNNTVGGSALIGQQEVLVPAVSVTRVSVVSDPGADKTYGGGDTIRVQVTFNQLVVNVDTSGGTPRLKIDMDPAEWGEKWASYARAAAARPISSSPTPWWSPTYPPRASPCWRAPWSSTAAPSAPGTRTPAWPTPAWPMTRTTR